MYDTILKNLLINERFYVGDKTYKVTDSMNKDGMVETKQLLVAHIYTMFSADTIVLSNNSGKPCTFFDKITAREEAAKAEKK